MNWMDDVTQRMPRLMAALLVAALAVSSLIGCGPIRSTSRIGKAEVAYERARVADGYKKAPYEFYSARYYLHKAKEEWGYSDFEAAYDYATEAKRAAESAVRKSKEDPWADPVDGRNKTYELGPRETITADPEEIREIEGVDEDENEGGDDEAGDEDNASGGRS